MPKHQRKLRKTPRRQLSQRGQRETDCSCCGFLSLPVLTLANSVCHGCCKSLQPLISGWVILRAVTETSDKRADGVPEFVLWNVLKGHRFVVSFDLNLSSPGTEINPAALGVKRASRLQLHLRIVEKGLLSLLIASPRECGRLLRLASHDRANPVCWLAEAFSYQRS